MKILIIITLLIALLMTIFVVIDGYRSSPFSFLIVGLLVYPFMFLMPINLLSVFVFWGKYKIKSFIPFVISVLCFCFVLGIGRLSNHLPLYVFEKRLPLYEELVRKIESEIEDDPISLSCEEIPVGYRHLCYSIYAEKDGNGVLTVEFVWNKFLREYTAYVFRLGDEPVGETIYFRDRWYSCYKITDHWYRVRNWPYP